MKIKIDVAAILFLLGQNRHQTHDWTLIGSGANGLGIQGCWKLCLIKYELDILSGGGGTP